MMLKLTIDNREVEVEEGATILDAARKLGIRIPTLCFLEGHRAPTSCMVCVVRLQNQNRLIPSCAAKVVDGMRIESETEEIHRARRAAIELLLSDHVGDCMAPCQNTCPAHMNIPQMIRQIAAGRLREAIITVKKDIALPAVLGRICPAPCEKGCRRSIHDAAVSICLLKRYAADADLASATPYVPHKKSPSGKKVAIVGAGPTGLAAAFHLLQDGHACMIVDDHESPGGMLRYAVPEDRLPREVLDAEIGIIRKLGAEFRMSVRIGRDLSLNELRKDFDAVLIAVGEVKPGDAQSLGLVTTDHGIEVDKDTSETGLDGVYAAGSAVRSHRMAVIAVEDGKAAATSIDELLRGAPVKHLHKRFSVHMGHLKDGEIAVFVAGASSAARVVSEKGGCFGEREVIDETRRCLHCDCRKVDHCKLRQYAESLGASANRYRGERRMFEQQLGHPEIVFEPGKCIDCGLCIQITADRGERLGLTFVGRGFNVRVAVPFDHSVEEGLRKVGNECVAACPTGALAFREKA